MTKQRQNDKADEDHERALNNHDNFNEDHDSLITIKTQVGQIKEIMDKIDKTLMGNGKEGICSTVARNTIDIKSIQDMHEKQQKNTLILVGLIVSTGVLVMAILNYVKI